MPKRRILIADDEEGIREALGLILDGDYEVSFVTDGKQALAKLKQGRFDLAMLDLKMPKLDGVEILKRMKRAGVHTPVVVLTAYQSVELAKEAIHLGALDYLPKPFDQQRVLTTVHGVLPRR